jgi:asparagine synthase (glutamine-hydrolysing)
MNAAPAGVLNFASHFAPGKIRRNMKPQRFKRVAAGIGRQTKHEYYKFLMQQWPRNMLRRPDTPDRSIFFDKFDIEEQCDPFSGMMYIDAGSYLPDDILVKVDRASMATSLESRVPLLDHRIVEFASTLPLELKRRDGTGKWLLRRVLDRYVPRALIDRPKQGFGMPIAEWLRGPLKAWGEDLLHDEGTVVSELIDLPTVREVWKEHQEGSLDNSYKLWVILMLVAWSREWRPSLG